jgi:outer membrane protein OmpA-like peptidoglycan-associated protein
VKCLQALSFLLFTVPALAPAQVIFHPDALQQLRGIAPAVTPVAMQVVAPKVHRTHHKLVAAVVTKPKQVAMVPVVAKPLVPVIAKPAPPAPPATIAVNFADGSAALPASAGAALTPFCTWSGTITINAHAPADPSNPSNAMRLSMERAFAIRDALTACGVPGSRILPVADGAAGGTETSVSIGPQK